MTPELERLLQEAEELVVSTVKLRPAVLIVSDLFKALRESERERARLASEGRSVAAAEREVATLRADLGALVSAAHAITASDALRNILTLRADLRAASRALEHARHRTHAHYPEGCNACADLNDALARPGVAEAAKGGGDAQI